LTRPTTHTAVYEFEDGAWNVRINGQRGCLSYGRSIRQAKDRIREALAVWLDTEPDGLVIIDQFPRHLAEVAAGVERARAAAEQAASTAQRLTNEAAQQLTARGLSRRDAAELLGLSHQRVQQLLETR
jgi:predicted RNase H-like HicB family nuclease